MMRVGRSGRSGRDELERRQEHQDEHGRPAAGLHSADLRLVESILAGNVAAWQLFLERYLAVVTGAMRSSLFDDDDVRSTAVDLFADLHDGGLRSYQGRSSLATWLFLIARNHAADTLRRRYGRREMPRGLRGLDTLHQEAFKLYHVEGLSFATVLRRLRLLDPMLDDDRLIDVLALISDRLQDRSLRRVHYDLAARSLGSVSGRLLEYCDARLGEISAQEAEADPLERLIAEESAGLARRALQLIADLPERERRILSLRFGQGKNAREIATELGLGSQRRAYTVLDGILRRLRARLACLGSDPGADPEPVGGNSQDVSDLTYLHASEESRFSNPEG